MVTKVCMRCGGVFEARKASVKYCSSDCWGSVYLPSPEEIEQRKAMIQEKWSEHERQSRVVGDGVHETHLAGVEDDDY